VLFKQEGLDGEMVTHLAYDFAERRRVEQKQQQQTTTKVPWKNFKVILILQLRLNE